MRQLSIILFLFTSLNAVGQTCDTISGQFINCVDNMGRKQGYWKIREKIFMYSSYSNFGSDGGCNYDEENKYLTKAEGHYKDNKKIGTWKIYSDNDHLISVEKEITFTDKGVIQVELFPYSVLEINNDTSKVIGYIHYKGDSIVWNCINNNCTFKLNNDKDLLTFNFTNFINFEFEFLRLKIGMYDRKILQLKANR